MNHFYFRRLKNGCIRIVEIVGRTANDQPMTIDWPGLYETKQSAIKDIETETKTALSDDEYKALMFRPELGESQ